MMINSHKKWLVTLWPIIIVIILYTDLASRAIRPFFLEGGEPSNKPHVVEYL